MSSTNCGKCNKLNCGCSGHGLTTPCNYKNCSDPNAEYCDSVECMSCISNCGRAFSVEIGGVTIKVEEGERLRETIQNILLYLKNPQATTLAPYNVNVSVLVANSLTVRWDQASAYGVEVHYKKVGDNAFIEAGTGINGNAFEITNLLAGTEYIIKVLSMTGDSSVGVYATTL